MYAASRVKTDLGRIVTQGHEGSRSDARSLSRTHTERLAQKWWYIRSGRAVLEYSEVSITRPIRSSVKLDKDEAHRGYPPRVHITFQRNSFSFLTLSTLRDKHTLPQLSPPSELKSTHSFLVDNQLRLLVFPPAITLPAPLLPYRWLFTHLSSANTYPRHKHHQTAFPRLSDPSTSLLTSPTSNKMSQHFQHQSDYLLSRTGIQLPTNESIPREYRPMKDQSDQWVKAVIGDLWHISNIKQISLPATSRCRGLAQPPVFLVETSDGNIYEYLYPTTHDQSPGPHLLRKVDEKGWRGPWEQPVYWKEAIEKNARELKESTWGKPLGPLTLEQRAFVTGLQELRWMDLRGMDRFHSGVFWLKEGRPEIETLDQRTMFVGKWKEHAKVCQFEKRNCVHSREG
ncbi:hypothetical protein BJ508DRAFT_338664 [Ascobolus immersus RN42]|uniref:Uncharacterized protein n=1 Tax=Ascobolus immersus RN42 TaxID=1160509 RepID=A0A3N4HP93_ASCIM|nr:hypothetical protein BJ508DRAFT_338664 [Ascobolus immersus RN42]